VSRRCRPGTFQVAEGIFEDILRQNPNHPDANFMMGVALLPRP
jgi:hypothetical protein